MTTANYQALANTYATNVGIDPDIFSAQIQAESGFNPRAVSPAGAQGIAQFMPSTARGLGLNPFDPIASLQAAAQYDSRNLKTYGGDYAKMLAAYNAGNGAVNSAVNQHGSSWLSFMPSETQNYDKTIMATQSVGHATGGGAMPATAPPASSGNAILDTFRQWGEYIAIFLIAVVLISVGFFLLAEKQATAIAEKVM